MRKLSQFNKDCVRLSILYALNGESSVPALHVRHIAQYVYPKLLAAKDYDEMELLTKTINARLKYILETTISFEVRPDGQPVNDLIEFMKDYDVRSLAELLGFDRIWYDDYSKRYTYIRKKTLDLNSNPYKYQITKFDLEYLCIWQNLASLFDVDCHHCIYTSDNNTDNDEEFFGGWAYNESTKKFEEIRIPINNHKGKNICRLNKGIKTEEYLIFI